MNSRTRSRRPASIGSNQSSSRWPAVSASDCRAGAFVLLLIMAWSPPALKRRDCLGFSTRRLRHLQFQPHPGRHHSLSFIGQSAFTTADQVRFAYEGSNTAVQVNLDSDANPEMEVLLLGHVTLTASDFESY